MIIDRNGEILEYFMSTEGIVIKDGAFSICLTYDETQKEQAARMNELKAKLNNTDYQAIKFSDGAITEEKYAPIRKQRAAWRSEINQIQQAFTEPTITREEMDAAEAKAILNMQMRGITMGG